LLGLEVMKNLSFSLIISILALLVSCNANIHSDYHVDHLNAYTPWEGKGDVSWVSAMLSTIETEHIMRGDSVNLSPFYAIRNYYEKGYQKLGGSPMLLIEIIEKYGIVPYDSYSRSKDDPLPFRVFMLGAEYTPGEFARSVCAPNEYMLLEQSDSLLDITVKAVNANHGVCWQATNNDCKAIVGLAHDDANTPYLIMKDSTGLVYISYVDFKLQTKAIVLPRK